MWSDPNLRSFMAVTAHYASKDRNQNLVICSRLVAFRHVSGIHSGENLAKHFFAILKELGVLHKVCITCMFNMDFFIFNLSLRSVWSLLTMHLIATR